MVYIVIINVAKEALVGPREGPKTTTLRGGPKTITSNDNKVEVEPLDLKAQTLFHIVDFYYVYIN